MEVNASGPLLAANGRDVVFRLLFPLLATKGESPGSSGRLRALGMSYSPTERLAGQLMRPPVTVGVALCVIRYIFRCRRSFFLFSFTEEIQSLQLSRGLNIVLVLDWVLWMHIEWS